MKRLAPLALIAALALTGCVSAEPSAESMPAPTVKPVKETASADLAALKSEAIKAGRPESAWDKNCAAWELPSNNGENQAWANKLGTAWLAAHNNAGCPDAITWPSYYVESWGSSKTGELTIYAEDTESTEWVSIAQDVMCKVSKDSTVENVRVLTVSGDARAHWGRAEMKKTDVC